MWLFANFYPILMRPRGLKVLVLCVLADALESAVMAQNVHAPNANAQLLQASNEVSQASGENRASNGPPSARDAPRTSTEPRHRADAASMAWRPHERRRRRDPPREMKTTILTEKTPAPQESHHSPHVRKETSPSRDRYPKNTKRRSPRPRGTLEARRAAAPLAPATTRRPT